jgi:hypothetical protein
MFLTCIRPCPRNRDAAGHGWFVDPSPAEWFEFAGSGTVLQARADGPAAGRMDLMTALLHEIGHVLGFDHDSAGGGHPHTACPRAGRRPAVTFNLGADGRATRHLRSVVVPPDRPLLSILSDFPAPVQNGTGRSATVVHEVRKSVLDDLDAMPAQPAVEPVTAAVLDRAGQEPPASFIETVPDADVDWSGSKDWLAGGGKA